MDEKNTESGQIAMFRTALISSKIPKQLQEKAFSMIETLEVIRQSPQFFIEKDTVSKYINWIIKIPWDKKSENVMDIKQTEEILNKNHYGLQDLKERILEYLSVLIMRKRENFEEISFHAPILSLVGLTGSGKTTIAYSIAEALSRKIARIPFGGLGSPIMLRGQSRFLPNAEPGAIIKAIIKCDVSNPVILLDEIDRVSEGGRSDIMGTLVELLDPEQNHAFIDHYVDYPFDLSDVLFIATSNNTKDIANAVLDRLEVLQMPSYTDPEKIVIGKSYMFPKILKESGLGPLDLVIEDSVWEKIVRPLGYDSGTRSLERTIEGIVRKVTHDIIDGIISKGKGFTINQENIKDFIQQW